MRLGPPLLLSIGIAFFCAMDAAMKHLIASNPVIMTTWWRYIFAILFTWGFWVQAGKPRIGREILPIHLLRGAIISATAIGFFWSLTRLTLAEAVTFSFIAPLLVPPLASLLLGEKMQAGNLLAGALGFVGVLVAVGFDLEVLSRDRLQGIVAVLAAAFGYALSLILMRARAAKDGPTVLSLLGAVIPAILIAPVMLAMVPLQSIVPRDGDIIWFVLAGLFGALALQFIARAYALAQAQVLAPFEYTALAWAALIGWALFAEPVSLRTWAGAALIIAACLWQARRTTLEAPTNPAA